MLKLLSLDKHRQNLIQLVSLIFNYENVVNSERILIYMYS